MRGPAHPCWCIEGESRPSSEPPFEPLPHLTLRRQQFTSARLKGQEPSCILSISICASIPFRKHDRVPEWRNGRRQGLKIPCSERGVPVRVRAPAPNTAQLGNMVDSSSPLFGACFARALPVLSWRAASFLTPSARSASDTMAYRR